MQYSRATVGPMQLDDYVRVVPQIYGAHDQNRSIWDVWCHTLHHGAAVAERIRKNEPPDKLFREIADFSLWLFTFVQKLSGRPGKRKSPNETDVETLIRIASSCSDLIWHRYPGVCHLCYARRTKTDRRRGLLNLCDCAAHPPDCREKKTKRLDSRDLRRFSEANRGRKPKTIDRWQAMFGDVFKANIERLSLLEIGFHLMEELGEVSDAMVRMYSYTENDFRAGEPVWRQARLEGQIADVFSWLFALVEKLNHLERKEAQANRKAGGTRSPSPEPVTLSGVIWRRYGSERLQSFRCPACDRAVCSCRLLFVPATRPVREWLQKFRPGHGKKRAKKHPTPARTK
jgi:NTP pyrophosphatase (non-canonical NTP hydrolase)